MAGASTAGDRLSEAVNRGTGPALRGPALFVRPRRLIAGFAVVLVGLAACAGEPDVLTLDQDDSGTEVRLAVGEEMEVHLRSNASTGYSWRLAGDDLDEDVVQVLSSQYEPDEGSEDLAGAGGTEIWRFRARGPGSVPVALEYTFGGDETREPAGEFSVVVTVE